VRGKQFWKIALAGGHLALWGVLAILSYQSAGPYSFATCWPIAMIYPPFALLWMAVALTSLAVVMMSISRPRIRSGIWFGLSCHGLILVGGMLVARVAAHVSAGQVSCL
jgi:hypothetical protein